MDDSCAKARFSIGDVIHHLRFNYRGVIYDIDPVYAGSDEWYEKVARSRPPKDRPWYRVLVDGSNRETYVAERHLEKDTSRKPIRHPALGQVFGGYVDGAYVTRRRPQ